MDSITELVRGEEFSRYDSASGVGFRYQPAVIGHLVRRSQPEYAELEMPITGTPVQNGKRRRITIAATARQPVAESELLFRDGVYSRNHILVHGSRKVLYDQNPEFAFTVLAVKAQIMAGKNFEHWESQ